VAAGEVVVIPPNLPHRAEALHDTVEFGIFNPPRTLSATRCRDSRHSIPCPKLFSPPGPIPLSADSRETVTQLEFPVGIALHGTTESCARATSRRSRHAWGPNGTILLLASCPMSARPNQGIPDLRHQ
jgi:hypothetical protein